MFETEAISPALQSLLDLFEQNFAEVKFPDLDRTSLEVASALVRERAAALAEAKAKVEAAKTALAESQEALLQKGQRAHAYLRVFCEENPELSAKLDAISLPRPGKKSASPTSTSTDGTVVATPPKRRGRPAKVAPEAPLFDATPVEPEPFSIANPLEPEPFSIAS